MDYYFSKLYFIFFEPLLLFIFNNLTENLLNYFYLFFIFYILIIGIFIEIYTRSSKTHKLVLLNKQDRLNIFYCKFNNWGNFKNINNEIISKSPETLECVDEFKPYSLSYKFNTFLFSNNLISKENWLISMSLKLTYFMFTLQLFYFLSNKLYCDLFSISFFENFVFLNCIKLMILFFTILFFHVLLHYFDLEGVKKFEFIVTINYISCLLLIFLTVDNFIDLYLALEAQTLALIVLAAFTRKNSSAEAAIKFLIIAAIGSGFFLLGCSFLYGFTGSLTFNDISLLTFDGSIEYNVAFISAWIFILVGLLFKLGIAPFHFWLIDFYEGIPTIYLLYFAVIPKIAGIGLFTIILNNIICNIYALEIITFNLSLLAILTIFLGIIGIFYERKIRRFIAYSSIVNIGFLIFVVSNTAANTDISLIFFNIILYLFTYSLSLFGLLTILLVLIKWSNYKYIRDWSELSGFSKLNLGLAILFIINLFSIAGIPPLFGFFGKFSLVFSLLISQNSIFYLIFFMLLGVISAAYYIRIIKLLLFDKVNLNWVNRPIQKNISFISIIISLIQAFIFLKPLFLLILFILF